MEKKLNELKDVMVPDLIVLSLQTIGTNPFEKLVELCEPITYSVIKRYFFQDYEREDFLQEARIVLVKASHDWQLDRGMPFTQYYHMQLTNHLKMLVRKRHAQKRKVNLDTTSLSSLVQEVGIHIEGVAQSMTQPEELTIARDTYGKYLDELSELESQVYQLFLKGITHEEISVQLNITSRQARSALYRCKLKLKNLID